MEDEAYSDLVTRGIALAEDKEYAEAIRLLELAAELDETQPDAHYNLGVIYGLLAMTDLKHDDYFEDHVDEEILLQNAIEHYQAALEADPTHVAAHNNLGTIFALHGEKELAVHELETSLGLDPDQADIVQQLEELQGG